MAPPVIKLHKGDLSANIPFGESVAVDTETLGLNPQRDRLCLVQLSSGDGTAHIVQISRERIEAPHLINLLSNPKIMKIFHYARFDIAAIEKYLGIETKNIYCTKIASKLARTYTDKHGLKDLVSELLGIELSKQQQSSDWGAATLTQQQINYAASDVLYLHQIKEKLDAILVREGRHTYLDAALKFLPFRAKLDLIGYSEEDLFAH